MIKSHKNKIFSITAAIIWELIDTFWQISPDLSKLILLLLGYSEALKRAKKRLQEDFDNLKNGQLDGILLEASDSHIMTWNVNIMGNDGFVELLVRIAFKISIL